MKFTSADASPSRFEDVRPSGVALPVAPVRSMALPRRVVWIFALLIVVIWGISAGIPILIQHTSLKRRLTARIAAALGRQVEVGSYDFAFWGGPALEAQSVSLAEDPRFGHDYFLRAESVSLRLRWRSLLSGRLAIDTLSLIRPSLNLVLNDSGDWNLAEWLPRPSPSSTAGAPYPLRPLPALRFRRIQIEGGRINFKRGDDELPLALVGVTGAADTDFSGRWRLDLTASPWRAAVAMQQAGILHASGYVGGTSSRLRPAKLDVTWSEASLSDVLRLARGDDYGIRGTLAASISASTHDQNDGWTINARTQLGQVHRWDLALRSDNPSTNMNFNVEWHPDDESLALNPIVVEAPHSNARLSAQFFWGHPRFAAKPLPSPLYAELTESQIDAGDVLSWLRAFHTGVADDASVQGLALVRGVVTGWPVRVINAAVSSDGMTLTGGGLRQPARLGGVHFRYDHGQVSLLPVGLSLGPSDADNAPTPQSALRIEASTKSGRRAVSNVAHVSGSLADVRDLLAAASALGWQLAHGSDLAGPVHGDVRWQGTQFPWQGAPVGFVDWGAGHGGSLRLPFLNLPIQGVRARLDLEPHFSRMTLTSAEAFGANWNGTLERRTPDSEWRFMLSADHLAASDLDRWLNPRWRESFFGRVFPFLSSRSTTVNTAPENYRASGHLQIARFNINSLALDHLGGDLRIDGRAMELTNAVAQLGGGPVLGSFAARLDPASTYETDFEFSGVDLSTITDADPLVAGLFDGSASGVISFRASGATRADLLASLSCHGHASIARPLLRQIDLVSSLRDAVVRPGPSHLTHANADFSCEQQSVRLENVSLDSPGSSLEGSGTVDFNRNLNINLRTPGANSPEYHLSGTLAMPEISAAPAAARSHSR